MVWWSVSIIRKKGELLGTVTAPDERGGDKECDDPLLFC
jgi:hypothetical protein